MSSKDINRYCPACNQVTKMIHTIKPRNYTVVETVKSYDYESYTCSKCNEAYQTLSTIRANSEKRKELFEVRK